MTAFDECMAALDRCKDELDRCHHATDGLVEQARQLHRAVRQTRTAFLVCWFGVFVPVVVLALIIAALKGTSHG